MPEDPINGYVALRERITRLEEQLSNSKADREELHRLLGTTFGRLDILERQMTKAQAVIWIASTLSACGGFFAGIIQPWVGVGHK